jgi:hypothetical protein
MNASVGISWLLSFMACFSVLLAPQGGLNCRAFNDSLYSLNNVFGGRECKLIIAILFGLILDHFCHFKVGWPES